MENAVLPGIRKNKSIFNPYFRRFKLRDVVSKRSIWETMHDKESNEDESGVAALNSSVNHIRHQNLFISHKILKYAWSVGSNGHTKISRVDPKKLYSFFGSIYLSYITGLRWNRKEITTLIPFEIYQLFERNYVQNYKEITFNYQKLRIALRIVELCLMVVN